MFSSEDLECFYFQYQTEAFARGILLQDFYVKNKVPYNIFLKWYKDTRKKIVEVQVDGRPTEEAVSLSGATVSPLPVVSASSSLTRICVELRMNNGLHISQKNLTYQELTCMIEKLEGVC